MSQKILLYVMFVNWTQTVCLNAVFALRGVVNVYSCCVKLEKDLRTSYLNPQTLTDSLGGSAVTDFTYLRCPILSVFCVRCFCFLSGNRKRSQKVKSILVQFVLGDGHAAQDNYH